MDGHDTDLYEVEPGACGEYGERTEIPNADDVAAGRTYIAHVSRLHMVLDDWLGDDLVMCDDCYVVTERLASRLDKKGITGIEWREMELTRGENMAELYPRRRLPQLRWLVPTGKARLSLAGEVLDWSGDDVCFAVREGWVPRHRDPSEFAGHLEGPVGAYGLLVTDRCLAVLRKYDIEMSEVVPRPRVQPGG